MSAILEDVVVYAQSKPNPADLHKQTVLVTEGLVDLVQRLRNLEYHQLEQAHRISLLETGLGECKASVANVVSEHTSYKSRVEAVERAPVEIVKKLEEIEKRLRTLEGAVGSVAMKEAKAPSAGISLNPFKATDPVAST